MSIDELKLPQSGILSLSAGQIEKIIRKPKSNYELISLAFSPLSKEFINLNNADLWEEFCVEKINSHFHDLIDEQQELGIEISDELAHYPLFARRKILEIIKEKDFKLFLELIVKNPLCYYDCSQLWDPNKEVTAIVRTYFTYLAQAYLSSVSDSKVTADSYINFVNEVKSPYKNLDQVSNFYEADYSRSKFKGIFIQELIAARIGVILRLRQEQIEGMECGYFYMPAPVNLGAIKVLANRWLAEQAREFKINLAGRLLEFLLEQDKEKYKELLDSLGQSFQSIMLSGEDIRIDPEFTEFARAEIVYQQFLKVKDAKDIDQDLLAQVIVEFKNKKEYRVKDLSRASHSIRYLQGRKIYKPWEINTINSDIKGIQRQYYQIDSDLEKLNNKLSFLKSLASEVLEGEQEKILFDADRISVKYAFNKNKFRDPLLYEEIFSFENKNKLAFKIKNELSKKDYNDVKQDNIANAELVDYLHIWQEIVNGKKVKKLKKKYKDYRVNRVLIEFLRRNKKKSLNQIKELEPKLSKMVELVRGREDLDQTLSQYADLIIDFSKELDLENKKTNNNISKLDNFILFTQSVAIVWDWLTLQIENPYLSGSDKSNQFMPWFDKELSCFIREKDFKTYQALCCIRPASVLGLEPGADFNWKDNHTFKDYVSVITKLFLELSTNLFNDFIYFKRAISSPFIAFLNSNKYDLDSASNKVLLLDNSQKHLFNSEYRTDAMTFWADFHNQAYLGDNVFSGLLFELIMKELKENHSEEHRDFCIEMLESERIKVGELRQRVYSSADSPENNLENNLNSNLNFEVLDSRFSFLNLLKRNI